VAGEDDDNPYIREFARLNRYSGAAARQDIWIGPPGAASIWAERAACVRRYAFGVPTRAALEAIARYAPIIELGAGTGYWAYLLRRRGVDCAVYDLFPPDRAAENPNRFLPFTWTRVEQGGIDRLAGEDHRSLFLCWPSLADPFAADALEAYAGQTLVYVGEGVGGHTADETFFVCLAREWQEIESIALPNWPGTSDRLVVYRRREVSGVRDQVSGVGYQLAAGSVGAPLGSILTPQPPLPDPRERGS
jgi:hypothetical protein